MIGVERANLSQMQLAQRGEIKNDWQVRKVANRLSRNTMENKFEERNSIFLIERLNTAIFMMMRNLTFNRQTPFWLPLIKLPNITRRGPEVDSAAHTLHVIHLSDPRENGGV